MNLSQRGQSKVFVTEIPFRLIWSAYSNETLPQRETETHHALSFANVQSPALSQGNTRSVAAANRRKPQHAVPLGLGG
jgi:hypothetical protein